MVSKISDIKKMSVRGALYKRLHPKKEVRPKTRAGQALAILRRGEHTKFRVSVNRSLITLPSSNEVRNSSIMYPLIRPYSYANIKYDTTEGSLVYSLMEPRISEKENTSWTNCTRVSFR